MNVSIRARALLRRSPSYAAQWARSVPPSRLPFAVSVAGGRRWYALDEKPASGPVAVTPPSDAKAQVLESSSSQVDEVSGAAGEVVAPEASRSEVSDTSQGTAESDLASEVSTTSVGEPTSTKDPWCPEFGFAFDIDGVLLHKSNPIPGAAKTLKYLQKHKIPFILLTNGGGKSEADRVAELSTKLGVDLDTSYFVQSHTPYQLLATNSPANVPFSALPKYLRNNLGVSSLRNSTVLVLGSDASQARRIASGYGFQSVVTPGDILNAKPEMFPFDPLSDFYSKQEILPLPKPIYDPKNSDLNLEDCLKIDAILVFNDPRDWAFDIQLIVDLMLSHRGYLGTYSDHNSQTSWSPRKRWQRDGQPALVFSNMDLLWSTGYHLPRFGQGAFSEAVRAVFSQYTAQSGGEKKTTPYQLKAFEFGKPSVPMYHFAASKLHSRFKDLWQPAPETAQEALQGSDDDAQRVREPPETHEIHGTEEQHLPKLRKVYMVGDNPESDIRGAVQWSRQIKGRVPSPSGKAVSEPLWESCLVRTGVWNEHKTPLEVLPARMAKPDTVEDDVQAALNWALEKEGWPEKVE